VGAVILADLHQDLLEVGAEGVGSGLGEVLQIWFSTHSDFTRSSSAELSFPIFWISSSLAGAATSTKIEKRVSAGAGVAVMCFVGDGGRAAA